MRTLFRGIRTLLPDMSIAETNVAVEGDRILAVGDIPEGFAPDTTVEGKDRLLLPGLVNAHAHTYMTMFRGCADDLPFSEWLLFHIEPLEEQMTAEDCYWATLLGNMEMILCGTTASIDMFIYTETASRAAEECGFRTVLTRGLTGPDGGERRLREFFTEYEAWKGRCPRVTFALGPHAP